MDLVNKVRWSICVKNLHVAKNTKITAVKEMSTS